MAADSSVILVLGFTIGTLLVLALLFGYICIFQQLCCRTVDEKRQKRWGPFNNGTQELIQMADVSNTTHIESLATIDVDRASSISCHKNMST
jgi:hypothetical protein